MAYVDFTDKLEEMEKPVLGPSIAPQKYRKVVDTRLLPGIAVEVFVNVGNSDDIYLSPGFCCEVVGLARNWLNVSYRRPKTMRRLEDLGFSGEKRFIDVLVPNSPTGMTRPCLALSRSDFDALLDYACELKKSEAIALQNTFTATGLLSVAGLTDTPELYAEHFRAAYTSFLSDLGDA
jgi:hypothetical protein